MILQIIEEVGCICITSPLFLFPFPHPQHCHRDARVHMYTSKQKVTNCFSLSPPSLFFNMTSLLKTEYKRARKYSKDPTPENLKMAEKIYRQILTRDYKTLNEDDQTTYSLAEERLAAIEQGDDYSGLKETRWAGVHDVFTDELTTLKTKSVSCKESN